MTTFDEISLAPYKEIEKRKRRSAQEGYMRKETTMVFGRLLSCHTCMIHALRHALLDGEEIRSLRHPDSSLAIASVEARDGGEVVPCAWATHQLMQRSTA